MEFQIWVETRLADRTLERRLVTAVERKASGIGPEEIGLSLQEGKSLLSKLQTSIIQLQVEALEAANRKCVRCGRNQNVKDASRRVRTVFGSVRVSCRRYLRCTCRGGRSGTLWPLNCAQFPHTTPELEYLYATWGSKVPYRRAAAVLSELLPIASRAVSHSTLRRHALAVGERLDQRVMEPDEYDWPESRRERVSAAKNLSVAIDGTYIRADRVMGLNEYQVVAGRIECEGKMGSHFAWIAQHHSCDAETFMKATLQANGWTPESRVRVLADGADGLTNLVSATAKEKACRVLDWFHISMRLRVIEQMSPGIAASTKEHDPVLAELLIEKLPRVRHQMWNGKWHEALDRMGEAYRALKCLLNLLSASDSKRIHRFRQHMVNLRDYLCGNWQHLRNYSADRRNGLRISSAPAESAMSHLVNQRMGKRQPMRWSAGGAHLLLQVRCAVLDNKLDSLFREWHPNFRKSLTLSVV